MESKGKCLVIGDVKPGLITVLSSAGYEIVSKETSDNHEGLYFSACIIGENLKSTASWELYNANSKAQFEYISKDFKDFIYTLPSPKTIWVDEMILDYISRELPQFPSEWKFLEEVTTTLHKQTKGKKHKQPYWANDWRRKN